jgi:hypothetical protein
MLSYSEYHDTLTKNVDNQLLKLASDKDLKLKTMLEKNNLTELNSNYLGMSTYYLDKNTGYIWEWDNTTPDKYTMGEAYDFKKVNTKVYTELCNLNNLSIADNYNTQPNTL